LLSQFYPLFRTHDLRPPPTHIFPPFTTYSTRPHLHPDPSTPPTCLLPRPPAAFPVQYICTVTFYELVKNCSIPGYFLLFFAFFLTIFELFLQISANFCRFLTHFCLFLPIFYQFFSAYLTQTLQTNHLNPIFSSKSYIYPKKLRKFTSKIPNFSKFRTISVLNCVSLCLVFPLYFVPFNVSVKKQASGFWRRPGVKVVSNFTYWPVFSEVSASIFSKRLSRIFAESSFWASLLERVKAAAESSNLPIPRSW